MDVQITKASIDQKPLLFQLMQLYMHDSSEHANDDLNKDGIFTYRYFEDYWTGSDSIPFLIRCDGEIAGFVFVNSFTVVLKPGSGRAIAEFFVMRKYRKRGVGRYVAFHVFDMFPGHWEVRENATNVDGQIFWRKVIDEYTNGRFVETMIETRKWPKYPVQTFDNGES